MKRRVTSTTKSTKRSPRKGVAKLKKEADTHFSRYVRLRDSDSSGYGECITCGKRAHWKKQQAGHFVSRTASELRYDEENVNMQCVGCNMFKSGEQFAYSKALDLKYGNGTADKLWARRMTTHKWTVPELEQIIHDAKEQVNWLESEKS